MMNRQRGFSLVELLIVVAIAGILAAIAFPSFMQWRQDLEYREAARDIASVLRNVRARAIATNREHLVEFNIANRRYRLLRGNVASGSDWTIPSATVPPTTVVKDWVTLPATVNIVRTTNNIDICDSNVDVNIEFNPNGRSDTTCASCSLATAQFICIRDVNNINKYRVGVVSTTTGRTSISRWSGAAWVQ